MEKFYCRNFKIIQTIFTYIQKNFFANQFKSSPYSLDNFERWDPYVTYVIKFFWFHEIENHLKKQYCKLYHKLYKLHTEK